MMVRKTVQTSTKMQVVLFSIFTALPGIFMNRVFPLINVPFENQEESHLLILVLLPAMLIRSLNENFKAFFINLGEISMTGLITLASLAPGVLLAYFLLVTYRLGFAGIVITITAYSSVSLGLMIWKLQTRIIPELKR